MPRSRPLLDAVKPVVRSAGGRRRLRFGARLLLAVVLTLTSIGVAGYELMAGQMRQAQTDAYARVQDADVRSLEAVGREDDPTAGRPATDELIAAIARRDGVLEARLIDPRSVVVASGITGFGIGWRDTDQRIDRTLRKGESYAGPEADPRRDGRDFELIGPVHLPDGRYALEVSYDHAVLDADLRDVRQVLLLVGLLTLFGGTGVFYLVGGRVLLRSHRVALERATRDGLTDLLNHRAFQSEFRRAVSAARRFEEPLALVVLDLDDFKFINNKHGHPHGDAILARVAAVLRAGRPEDRAFRIGGDEFAVLLPRTDGAGAHTIVTRLDRAFTAAEVAVSMGVSELRAGESGEDLRAEADAALYEAKRRGVDMVHFDEIRDQVVLATADRTRQLRRLIDEARVSFAYQPIWDLGSQRLLGLEALMRPHPDDGLSGPTEAFDLAEKIGRVHELDVLCVTRALADRPDLPAEALLFLNLAPQSLDLDAGDGDWLLALVRDAGLTPERVVVEVTERFTSRTEDVVACLRHLRAQGFRIGLDDVGTGTSGLELLQQVQADYVKIDRGIVRSATTERDARAVLLAMATYAHQTGAYVIAAGVESDETLDFLATLEGHHRPGERLVRGGQGFVLGRESAGERGGLVAPGARRAPTGSP